MKMDNNDRKEYWSKRILPEGVKEELELRLEVLKDTMARLKPDLANPQAFMSDFSILQAEINVTNDILSFDEEAKDTISDLEKEGDYE